MNKVINLLLVKCAPVLLVKGIIMTHNNRDVFQSDIETIIELVGQCFWNISNKIGTKEKKPPGCGKWLSSSSNYSLSVSVESGRLRGVA